MGNYITYTTVWVVWKNLGLVPRSVHEDSVDLGRSQVKLLYQFNYDMLLRNTFGHFT